MKRNHRAASNALVLLRRFTAPQGIDNTPHFDRDGFIREMEVRAAQEDRELSDSERQTLERMIESYCRREGVVS